MNFPSNVEISQSQPVSSSRPALARSKTNVVPRSITDYYDNVDDKSWTVTDVYSEGSSKDSFKSCVEELQIKNVDVKMINCEKNEETVSNPACVHKYEVGVVVVSRSSQYLHLVGPLGDRWVETCVDPIRSLVFVEGVRTKEVYSVKMGTVGHMVVKECVKCNLDSKSESAIASPSLLWFGVEQSPCVRGDVGVVVGKEGERMVVQLEGPPAARIARLVLFHGEHFGHYDIHLLTKVLVWAWARKVVGGGAGKFLEGASAVKVEVHEDFVDPVNIEDLDAIKLDHEDHYDAVQADDQKTSVVETISINRQLQRLLLQRLQYLCV